MPRYIMQLKFNKRRESQVKLKKEQFKEFLTKMGMFMLAGPVEMHPRVLSELTEAISELLVIIFETSQE